MIAIVDYGMGNLRSVEKACERAGMDVFLTDDCAMVEQADAVILPGVGAFKRAMENLRVRGLIPSLEKVVQDGRPFLGICLGLQLLFDGSEESFGQGLVPGLGLIPGRVRRFPPGLKVPQMGWNQIDAVRRDPLMMGVPDHSYMYFVHSYFADPSDDSCILTTTDYGISFTSSAAVGNLYGIQYHPEKSSRMGMTILRNFGAIVDDYISSH